ncbi:MAG TPA: anti-sigma factor antagonist [Streptosporangiaceae bacterium]|nr:anti-sigma factor antagonist [Streptosporangiaceae bacterium]
MDDLAELEIGPPFAWPEGAGVLYGMGKGSLSVRYYPGPQGELVAELTGELDCYSGPSFREFLISAANMGFLNLILSLDEVEFLDSTGLGIVIGAFRRSTVNSGSFGLVCSHERLAKIFRITGLSKIFGVYDSVPEALAASAENNGLGGPDLLFRVYIPSERMYAAEAGRLIGLFRSWLTTTRGRGIRQSGYHTALGDLYEFYADASVAGAGLHEHFDSFSGFLGLCADNEAAAAELLAGMNLDRRASSDLVRRFSREVRRLQVDLRHEREQRILNLRQSLEQELLQNDIDARQLPGGQLTALVERLVPGPSAAESLALLAGSRPPTLAGTVTVNINPQIISAVESTVVQNVRGVVHLAPPAKELLTLIGRAGGDDAAALQSAVYELEDPDAPPARRSAAQGRLRKFLRQLAGTASDIGISLLEKYLEQKLGL